MEQNITEFIKKYDNIGEGVTLPKHWGRVSHLLPTSFFDPSDQRFDSCLAKFWPIIYQEVALIPDIPFSFRSILGIKSNI